MEINTVGLPSALRDLLLIWSRSFSEPRQIGTFFPNSRAVGKAMTRAVSERPASGVIELGAGTGPVTQQLLQKIPQELLTCIEIEQRFVDYLKQLHPGLDVICAPAEQLSDIWSERGNDQAGAIVSTIPIRLFPERTTARVMEASLEVLVPGGLFVQQTLRPSSPIPERLVSDFGLSSKRYSIVLTNLPPAYLWLYQRREPTAARGN